MDTSLSMCVIESLSVDGLLGGDGRSSLWAPQTIPIDDERVVRLILDESNSGQAKSCFDCGLSMLSLHNRNAALLRLP
jgi:hypothetical protein